MDNEVDGEDEDGITAVDNVPPSSMKRLSFVSAPTSLVIILSSLPTIDSIAGCVADKAIAAAVVVGLLLLLLLSEAGEVRRRCDAVASTIVLERSSFFASLVSETEVFAVNIPSEHSSFASSIANEQ